jgi:hypothetical protein
MEVPQPRGSAHGEKRQATPGDDIPPIHPQSFYNLSISLLLEATTISH